MALIKAKKVEIEIQKQTLDKAASKYVVLLKYEPEDYISTEILSMVCLTIGFSSVKTTDNISVEI